MTLKNDFILEKEKDLNEIALEFCEKNKKTLIFSKRTAFVPPINKICEMKNRVYFTEENNTFDVFTAKFSYFDAFIFVKKELNDFEKEFFRQIKLRHIRKIIAIPETNQ